MPTYLDPENRLVCSIESTSLSRAVLLHRGHLLHNSDFSKRGQQGPSGPRWLTEICATLFDEKVILVIGALDGYVDRRGFQILRTSRITLSSSGDHIKVLVCNQSEFGDNLRSSPTIQIGDHHGAQIELAANAQLEGIPDCDASDKDNCMKSHHVERKGPLSLHSSYHRNFWIGHGDDL